MFFFFPLSPSFEIDHWWKPHSQPVSSLYFALQGGNLRAGSSSRLELHVTHVTPILHAQMKKRHLSNWRSPLSLSTLLLSLWLSTLPILHFYCITAHIHVPAGLQTLYNSCCDELAAWTQNLYHSSDAVVNICNVSYIWAQWRVHPILSLPSRNAASVHAVLLR